MEVPSYDSKEAYDMKKHPFSFLKHGRDKEGDFGVRVVLHIPIGFLIGMSVIGHWVLPLTLAFIFVTYEENEDIHTRDQAWKDYFGALAGLVLSIFTIMGLRFGGILNV